MNACSAWFAEKRKKKGNEGPWITKSGSAT